MGREGEQLRCGGGGEQIRGQHDHDDQEEEEVCKDGVKRVDQVESRKKEQLLQENLEELEKPKESRHSLQLELDEQTEDARQLVLRLQVAEARNLEAQQTLERGEQAMLKAGARIRGLELEKLRCQLAREMEVEGLWQAMKELENKLKEQMEARSRDRMHYAKHLHGKNELPARRERELEDAREQVEILQGNLARCGAAPG